MQKQGRGENTEDHPATENRSKESLDDYSTSAACMTMQQM